MTAAIIDFDAREPRHPSIGGRFTTDLADGRDKRRVTKPVITALRETLRRFRDARAQRRTLADLQAVDPWTMKDLGIDRSEVMSLVYSDPAERRRGFAWD